MVCPYAKSIKGVIVECAAAGRKVSALRYPCRGRYQNCPIYRKAKERERAAAARSQGQARVEAEKPKAPAEQSAAPEKPVSPPQAQPAAGAAEAPAAAELEGLLCDEVYRVEVGLAREAGTFVAMGREDLRKIADTLSEPGHYVLIELSHSGKTYEILFDGKNPVSARADGVCRLALFNEIPEEEVLIVKAKLVRKPRV